MLSASFLSKISCDALIVFSFCTSIVARTVDFTFFLVTSWRRIIIWKKIYSMVYKSINVFFRKKPIKRQKSSRKRKESWFKTILWLINCNPKIPTSLLWIVRILRSKPRRLFGNLHWKIKVRSFLGGYSHFLRCRKIIMPPAKLFQSSYIITFDFLKVNNMP